MGDEPPQVERFLRVRQRSALSLSCAVEIAKRGNDMASLQGKSAIVTGGAGGIGRAIVLELARQGAMVAVSDIGAARAVSVSTEVEKAGGRAIPVETDVKDENDIRRLVAETAGAFGGVDILVNAAAAIGILDRDNDLLTLETDLWDETMAVNARGTMLTCKHAIPAMLKRGGGSIVNISSGAAETGLLSLPAYSASKGAILSLTRSIATLYGKQGIRCNAITPGQILHPRSEALIPDVLKRIDLDSVLTPYSGQAEDVAHAVAFLASAESRFITGHVLPVDGGLLAHIPTYADLRRLGNVSYVDQS